MLRRRKFLDEYKWQSGSEKYAAFSAMSDKRHSVELT